MATPLSADKMLAALKKEGVKVSEHSGWRTHNRAGHGAWGPVNGIIIHHTAGADSSAGLSLVYNGRSDLPGPLAHAYLSKSGTVTLTGNGRANHAGSGDDDVFRAVINEGTLPKPNENNTDGNVHFYGIEIANLGNGKDPYPTAQYDAAVKWAAAICRAHGWSSKSVIGHKEWTNQKIDPSFSMTTFRGDVQKQLNGTYKKPTTPTVPKAPTLPTKPTEGDNGMAIPGGPYNLAIRNTVEQTLAGPDWTDIVFSTEDSDEASLHATPSSEFGAEGFYNGAAYLKLSNVTEGTEIQARLVEVNTSGTEVKSHPIVEGIGTAGSTFFAVPFIGRLAAGRKLKLKVGQFDDADDVVIITSVELRMHWTIL